MVVQQLRGGGEYYSWSLWESPYDGPYKVLERTDKFFTPDFGGQKDTVSLDRLKPAYLEISPE